MPRRLAGEHGGLAPGRRGAGPPGPPEGTTRAIRACSEIAIGSRGPGAIPEWVTEGCIPVEAAAEADLLLNLSYDACASLMDSFRRTALIDPDPGLTQIWMSEGVLDVPPHDVYFTTGETVGRPQAAFPSAGVDWVYTPSCVALDHWPVAAVHNGAPFSTVSGWQTRTDWFTCGTESFCNSKREGFLPFVDVPSHSGERLELALCLAADEHLRLTSHDEEERQALETRGWKVVHSEAVAATPWDYQSYIRRSRGEFSCAKPSCWRLQNAWISNRTLCYLASGKPVVVEHTGPSRILPDSEGMFRFRSVARGRLRAGNHRGRLRISLPPCTRARGEAFRRPPGRHAPAGERARVRQAPRTSVAILGYHKVGKPVPPAWETWYYVSEEVFADQLQLVLALGWEPIDAQRLVEALTGGAELPPRSVLVTFDDGFRSVLEHALPHMRRLGFPGVMFTPTAYVGRTNEFDRETSQPQEPICDWHELRELEQGGVSIQSHSATHPAFSTLSAAELRRELRDSKAALEERLGRAVELLAYPYGDAGVEQPVVEAALGEAGYRAAFLYGGGPFRLPANSVFRLPRLAMGAETNLEADLS